MHRRPRPVTMPIIQTEEHAYKTLFRCRHLVVAIASKIGMTESIASIRTWQAFGSADAALWVAKF